MASPIKPTIKTEILPLIIVLITAAASFYFYTHFPERVPIHWNAAGQVDNWGGRGLAAFLFPGIILGMYLLFLVLPYADPKKERYQEFRRVYHVFKGVMVLFMAGIYFIASLSGLGYNIPIVLCVPGLVGLLFMIIGYYMDKIKPNWFMGIRTPWTLSSEKVWAKTHSFGGKVFIAGGAFMALMYFLPVSWRGPLFIADIIFIVLGTVGYSYILYRKEEG